MGFLNLTRNKKTLAWLIAAAMLVGNTMPAMASEGNAQEVSFSNWAFDTLLEGEKYGIFPMDWYDNMRATIVTEQVEALAAAIGSKLMAVDGVKLKAEPAPTTYEKGTAREDVLNAIFKELTRYEYTKDLGLESYTALEYMKEKGIIKGDTKGLNLNEPCTLEEAAIFGTRIIDEIYGELKAGSKGLLWKTTKGENTVYMLGSIHLADTSVYPFSETVKNAYTTSDALVVELNIYNEAGITDYNTIGMYTDGTTIKDHISAENYTKLLKVADQLGMTEKEIAIYKPWNLTNSFSSMISTNAEDQVEAQMAALLGIDNYFITNAIVYSKPIFELESYKYQAEMFDKMSNELQQYQLGPILDEMIKPSQAAEDESLVDAWLKHWEKGDLEGFKKVADTEEAWDNPKLKEEYTNALLTVRNKNMTDKIVELLEAEGSHTYFVVVGSLHYTGQDNILDSLTAKGFKVAQVK